MSTHPGSLNSKLLVMAVGEVAYYERDIAECAKLQRAITLTSRWPQEMKGRVYKTSTYTAVGSAAIGDVKYLVRVERVS